MEICTLCKIHVNMNKYIFLLLSYTFCLTCVSQELTGNELLEKAIAHHDPNNHWQQFKGKLFITMETPNASDRVSEISLNLPAEHFKLKWHRDKDTVIQKLDKDSCFISLNGSEEIPKKKRDELRLDCERTKVMKDYYVYLYGLPMKLKDPGTIVDPKVERKEFKGKEYFRLRVTYEESVGNDIWYFYFDTKTYAMEVYQFFHEESENDGEYILLSGTESINGINMPRKRAWYYNKDDKYLGTDFLLKAVPLQNP